MSYGGRHFPGRFTPLDTWPTKEILSHAITARRTKEDESQGLTNHHQRAASSQQALLRWHRSTSCWSSLKTQRRRPWSWQRRASSVGAWTYTGFDCVSAGRPVCTPDGYDWREMCWDRGCARGAAAIQDIPYSYRHTHCVIGLYTAQCRCDRLWNVANSPCNRQTAGHRDRDVATFRQCHNTEYNQHDVAIFPSTKIVILSD